MKTLFTTLLCVGCAAVASAAVDLSSTVTLYDIADGVTFESGDETVSVSSFSGSEGLDLKVTSTDAALLSATSTDEQASYSITFTLDLGRVLSGQTEYLVNVAHPDKSDGNIGLKANGDASLELLWNNSHFSKTGQTCKVWLKTDGVLDPATVGSIYDISAENPNGFASFTLSVDRTGTALYNSAGVAILDSSSLHAAGNHYVGEIMLNSEYIDNVAITPSKLTDVASIKTVSLLVPEPTTATLSLLALAGLAARRRRK